MSRRTRTLAAKKPPAAMRVRVAEHLAWLGHLSVESYLPWCRGHGFEPTTDKNGAQIAAEARAHAQDLERARLR